jgi:hypothetical protein
MAVHFERHSNVKGFKDTLEIGLLSGSETTTDHASVYEREVRLVSYMGYNIIFVIFRMILFFLPQKESFTPPATHLGEKQNSIN